MGFFSLGGGGIKSDWGGGELLCEQSQHFFWGGGSGQFQRGETPRPPEKASRKP